jgi:iron-sulfur cluster repair protein YtfE (RIC family)
LHARPAAKHLQDTFAQMRMDMEAHFKEEEEVVVPLMRKHFT